MGPRSWDRGERARECAGPRRPPGFNGAAVLGPRRAMDYGDQTGLAGNASMGPRSWDRGAQPPAAQGREGRDASMGPRYWGRGEREAARARPRLRGHLMGPRAWDTGVETGRRLHHS